MHEESADRTGEKIEYRDQYLGVLLEFYLIREETRGQGPMGRAKLKYWTGIVRIFEEGFPPELLRRVRYRARRAEKLGFKSIQLAMVRYAWAVALSQWETPLEARDRWIRYLAESADEGTVVSFESFEARRRVRTMLEQVERSGLWPAPARRVHLGGC